MKQKNDINIGKRAADEAYQLFPNDSTSNICNRIGGTRKLLNDWYHGCVPSPIFLARLLNLGADIEYILTGRRAKKEAAPDFLAELEERMWIE